MLSGTEKYYDDIYSTMGKDYGAEVEKLHEFIQKYRCTPGNDLLDVACGTGTHAGLLVKYYNVLGRQDCRFIMIRRESMSAGCILA